MAENGSFGYFIPSSSDQLWLSISNFIMVYLLAIVSLFGVIANALNVCVLLKQGFRDIINFSLLALAVSDLGTLFSALIMSACSNPALLNSELPVAFNNVETIFGGFPRATFSRITNCFTTFITFERFMCVVFPIKVKGIITARVTVVTLVTIFLTQSSTVIPSYLWIRVGWSYNIPSNRMILTMYFDLCHGPSNIKIFLNVNTCFQIMSFISVTIFTTVLVVELRKQSRWRSVSMTPRGDNSSKHATLKLNKTIRMVTSMAIVYIACYSVSVSHLVYDALNPHYAKDLNDVFWMMMSSAYFLESVNASKGICLYYTMSTKYKATFKQMFLSCCYAKFKKLSVASRVDSPAARF